MTETDLLLSHLINQLNTFSVDIKVSNKYHEQMKQVNDLLNNDRTAIISPIMDFMIRAANVPIDFDATKTGMVELLNYWKENVNKDVNIDIPWGLRSVSEQYYRERWTSSFIVLRMIWEKYNGYLLPMKMWFLDGANVYATNKENRLDTVKYYIRKISENNLLDNTDTTSVLIRKPYNQQYKLYPMPYLVKRGALDHALRKIKVIEHQNKMLVTSFPYQLLLKLGSPELTSKNIVPQPQDFKDIATKYEDESKKDKSSAVVGAYPYHFKIEELIPDFGKILDEKITKPIDQALLSAMGMIELKGFSSTREEAILNPKVLVEEVEDAVLDYKDLLQTVVKMIQEKNSSKYNVNDKAIVQPGVIKAFLTKDDKALIRSWYDRGLVGDKSGLENTTGLLFERQVKERDRERKEKLDLRMFPRVVQNLDNGQNDTSNNTTPDDKKKNTPEVVNYKNATQIQEDVDKANQAMDELEDDLITELGEVIEKELGEYLEAPYSKTSELPDSVKNNMGNRLQKIFMQVVNNALKNGDSEEIAFKKAWATISKIAHQNKSGKWVLNKKD